MGGDTDGSEETTAGEGSTSDMDATTEGADDLDELEAAAEESMGYLKTAFTAEGMECRGPDPEELGPGISESVGQVSVLLLCIDEDEDAFLLVTPDYEEDHPAYHDSDILQFQVKSVIDATVEAGGHEPVDGEHSIWTYGQGLMLLYSVKDHEWIMDTVEASLPATDPGSAAGVVPQPLSRQQAEDGLLGLRSSFEGVGMDCDGPDAAQIDPEVGQHPGAVDQLLLCTTSDGATVLVAPNVEDADQADTRELIETVADQWEEGLRAAGEEPATVNVASSDHYVFVYPERDEMLVLQVFVSGDW
ncbi:hypothetical protein ACQBAT_12290 [Ornithinimicrobium sp. Y1847]|uniref:hypothetical protein n=2 Tax=Ornithinimicrobium sp. Y1847 TaxID=3405419 RepID=UPI003D0422C3